MLVYALSQVKHGILFIADEKDYVTSHDYYCYYKLFIIQSYKLLDYVTNWVSHKYERHKT